MARYQKFHYYLVILWKFSTIMEKYTFPPYSWNRKNVFFFVFWVVRIKYVLVFSYFEFFDSKYLYFLRKQFFFEILFFFQPFLLVSTLMRIIIVICRSAKITDTATCSCHNEHNDYTKKAEKNSDSSIGFRSSHGKIIDVVFEFVAFPCCFLKSQYLLTYLPCIL